MLFVAAAPRRVPGGRRPARLPMSTNRRPLAAASLARPPASPRPAPAAAAARRRASGERQEVTSGAYRRLRELIVTGRLAPGAPLIETDLSERLGVSRTPVRAALQRLHQEGFVAASRSGQMLRAFVAPLTAGDMREVFLMVGSLEAVAARQAAALGEVGRAALCDTLAALDGELRDAAGARPPDLVRAQDLHVRFRRAFVEAAAGPRLRGELDVLAAQAERYERVYAGAILLAFEEGAAERAAVVAALRAGEAEAAERAVAASWRAAAERYGRVVSILGERGNW
ncbi:MAG: GntR family transcriptional regulator [Acidobacteria bacterium]|nr:GntR family transcriptional regulator [Acidobacteriota bacterium]